MPIRSRANAWVLASSLLVAAAGAAAQTQPEIRESAAPQGPRDTRLESRRSGTGRDQFIAPVMGIQIEGDGLNLPPGVSEDEPIKPPAKPEETKKEEPRSTEK